MKQPMQEVLAYEYALATDGEPADWVSETAAGFTQPTHTSDTAVSAEEFQRTMEEQAQKNFELGRVHGAEEARSSIRGEAEERLRLELQKIAGSFVAERDRYLQLVEDEVVKLALAIAARILWREAEMDPLILTGAVRVALGQLAASTRVRLRVPASHLDLWKEAVALVPNLAAHPEIIADETLETGGCILDTDLGQADLGVRAQLREIQRSFFESSAAAPQARQESV